MGDQEFRVGEYELRRRQVQRRRDHRPHRVVQIEQRRHRHQIERRGKVRIDRSDVAPVAAVDLRLAGDVVLGEVVCVHLHPRVHVGDDFLAEVVRRITQRVPLLAGRYFNRDDIGEGTGTAIINETMAQLCWPEEVAVGRKFRAPGAPGAGDQVYEVVGVVGDIRDYSYDQEVFPTFYRPYQELDLQGGPPTFLMRIQTDPRDLTQLIRKQLKAAEPAMGTPDIHVVKQQLYDSTQARRTYMMYLMVLAGAGLLLSALGIYGVLSYSVTRRTRELGIRLAVGAEARQVLAMVVREGARLIGAGVVMGLLAAFWLTRVLKKQLFEFFEVNPTNQVVFASVILFLVAVALLACLLPARRAAKIDPMEALRYE